MGEHEVIVVRLWLLFRHEKVACARIDLEVRRRLDGQGHKRRGLGCIVGDHKEGSCTRKASIVSPRCIPLILNPPHELVDSVAMQKCRVEIVLFFVTVLVLYVARLLEQIVLVDPKPSREHDGMPALLAVLTRVVFGKHEHLIVGRLE